MDFPESNPQLGQVPEFSLFLQGDLNTTMFAKLGNQLEHFT